MTTRTVKMIDIDKASAWDEGEVAVMIRFTHGMYTLHVDQTVEFTKKQWEVIKDEAIKEYLSEKK